MNTKLCTNPKPVDERGPSRRRRALVAMALALAFLPAALREARASSATFLIIVHPDNQRTALTRDFLEEAFLKKTTRWPDDEPIRPVDLPASSAVRQAFSQRILRRSVEAVKSYWQQRIFSGRDVPPPELASDVDVVAYVSKHRGAIGYVSSDADLGSTRMVRLK